MLMTKAELREAAKQLDQIAIDEPTSPEDEKLRALVRTIASAAYYVAGGKEVGR